MELISFYMREIEFLKTLCGKIRKYMGNILPGINNRIFLENKIRDFSHLLDESFGIEWKMLKHEINLYQFSCECRMTLCKIEVECSPPECMSLWNIASNFSSNFSFVTKAFHSLEQCNKNCLCTVCPSTWFEIIIGFLHCGDK